MPCLFDSSQIGQPGKFLLLYGEPGTGKTLLAQSICCEYEKQCNLILNFLSVDPCCILSKWKGETERKISNIFKYALQHQPCLIFFDEFEAIGSKRSNDDNGDSRQALSQILQEFTNIRQSKNQIYIIAATNTPKDLDDAIIRRFDVKIQGLICSNCLSQSIAIDIQQQTINNKRQTIKENLKQWIMNK